MISHLFAAELEKAAEALAAQVPDLTKLTLHQAQNGDTLRSPSLVILSELFKNYGKSAILRVTLTVESQAGDEKTAPPDNHLSRVQLVHQCFLTEKAALIALLNGRGNLVVIDWGQLPGTRPEAVQDTTGDKLRSPLLLLVAVRLPV